MGLSIKNEKAEKLVRRLVAQTGESVTQAISVAVEERLRRVTKGARGPEDRVERMREISRHAAKRWTLPIGSADHGKLLYDERGLPR